MQFQILIVLITLGFIFFPDIVLGQLTQQQLEIVKLEREIELLNQQIKNSNILYTQIIPPIIVGIGVAGATTFLHGNAKEEFLQLWNKRELFKIS